MMMQLLRVSNNITTLRSGDLAVRDRAHYMGKKPSTGSHGALKCRRVEAPAAAAVEFHRAAAPHLLG